ncbi:hypothetical protein EYZ11_004006 [Aspergillus tanneri]|uniref:Transcriptional regulator n=1 Tax=Aspergillus tanneri TaxID=1220188 RepID=A0A4S3JP13_9EURO|nr:uncharacterized protein ATNIH1004_007419 [Aspergillus tanneri]KAA8645997.1 hypothetical protein ATNIH1004_007419 [Aspergillus tanneri]THC96507.1 hypothetical protein EYZ11_004006 [Aspergillus tanneri]
MAPQYALSDSESESEPEQPAVPSDDALEKTLCDVVAEIYRSGNMDELTIKRVRLAATKALKIDEKFFKKSSVWDAKSDQIIKAAVAAHDNKPQESNGQEDDSDASSPIPTKSKRIKRTKPDAPAQRKGQKASTPESEDGEQDRDSATPSEMSDEDVKKPTKKRSKGAQGKKPQPKYAKTTVPEDSGSEAEQDSEPSVKPKADPKNDSESEMSVVLDEAPKPKPKPKRQMSAEAPAQKGKKKAATKAKDVDQDPNEAEIKRLQGWLIKCGIRKFWSRELAPYDTPNAKIKHLKGMLKDAGMEGRYSLEKANRIKEERELRADLEQVQEGAKRWGTCSGDQESDGSRPRRRLNRGRKSLAFLESDGDETD